MDDLRTLILDNGAYYAKYGYATDCEPSVAYNTVFKCRSDKKRTFVADELSECIDKAQLYYMLPFEKGYLVNWNVEFEVWDRLFGESAANVDHNTTRLLLTDISTVVPAFETQFGEIVFETYQFEALHLTAAPTLVGMCEYYENASENLIVVDSGYSFTHIVPYHKGRIVGCGVQRVDVGGKALTNQLKEVVSYKQLSVKNETYIMNECKEKTCFVSTDVKADMKAAMSGYANNPMIMDYVLPDFVNLMSGYAQPHSTERVETSKIKLGVERFMTPELLFHPSNVGLPQMGIAEAIAESAQRVVKEHPDLGFDARTTVVCTGGNVLFDGFVARLQQELRPLIEHNEPVEVRAPANPLTAAWSSAQRLIASGDSYINDAFVTRAQYAESGGSTLANKSDHFFAY